MHQKLLTKLVILSNPENGQIRPEYNFTFLVLHYTSFNVSAWRNVPFQKACVQQYHGLQEQRTATATVGLLLRQKTYDTGMLGDYETFREFLRPAIVKCLQQVKCICAKPLYHS